MEQPYLMGMPKIIKPAQLIAKDPAKLNHMMVVVLLLVLISCLLYTWGTFKICTIFEYWVDRKFLTNYL